MNTDKTFYTLFKPRCLNMKFTKDIYIAGKMVDKVKYIRFSGIYVDESLTFKFRSKHIRKKIVKGMGFTLKVRNSTETRTNGKSNICAQK